MPMQAAAGACTQAVAAAGGKYKMIPHSLMSGAFHEVSLMPCHHQPLQPGTARGRTPPGRV